jgi:hypothetical protein
LRLGSADDLVAALRWTDPAVMEALGRENRR